MAKVSKKYPAKIEVVSSAIIENNKGEILLTRSVKWNNKWTLPGGHLETGESIFASIIRETGEETGLKVNPICVISSGELISSRDFHREAHFLYFDVYCKLISGKLKIEKRELNDFRWILPEHALKLDLAETYPETVQRYIDYKKSTS